MTTSDTVNYHMKFSIPFASLIFSVLGACVGLRPHRSSSSIGLGISLVIIVGYYVLISIGLAWGCLVRCTPSCQRGCPISWTGGAALGILHRLAHR